MTVRKPPRPIEEIAANEAADYLRRASTTYLECCVSLMLTHMSREEVADILMQEAEMVRDLG